MSFFKLYLAFCIYVHTREELDTLLFLRGVWETKNIFKKGVVS